VNALLAHGKDGFLAPITRLDREVSGVMLLAKHKKSAAFYTTLLADRECFKKEYLAVVSGKLAEKEGEMHDLLFKDSAKNKSYVVARMRRGVKDASLAYEVLSEKGSDEETLSLLHIALHTGRTHQIRVQLSSRQHPIVGDRKYGGSPLHPMGLLSYRLTFRSVRGKPLSLTSERVKQPPFALFAAGTDEKDEISYK